MFLFLYKKVNIYKDVGMGRIHSSERGRPRFFRVWPRESRLIAERPEHVHDESGEANSKMVLSPDERTI